MFGGWRSLPPQGHQIYVLKVRFHGSEFLAGPGVGEHTHRHLPTDHCPPTTDPWPLTTDLCPHSQASWKPSPTSAAKGGKKYNE